MPARILVFGGRDYANRAMLFGVLDMIAEEQVINAVIQGECPTGADLFARMWAISRNHHLDSFPANWRAHGRGAGPIRNQQMIDEGKPTMAVAFPGGDGTADMLRRLKAARIPTQEIGNMMHTAPHAPLTRPPTEAEKKRLELRLELRRDTAAGLVAGRGR